MNAFFDAMLAAAQLHVPEVWERQRPAKLRVEGGVPRVPYDDSDHVLGGAAPASLATFYDNAYVVYPSGLVLAMADVPWYWEGEHETRYGTIRQAMTYLRVRKLPPDALRSVPTDRIHGQHVRYEGDRPELLGRDYRLVFARPFPTWTWGVTWGEK